MSEKKNSGLYVLLSSIIIAAAIIFIGFSNRFYIDSNTGIKVDRLTGRTYILSGAIWFEIENANLDFSDTYETETMRVE